MSDSLLTCQSTHRVHVRAAPPRFDRQGHRGTFAMNANPAATPFALTRDNLLRQAQPWLGTNVVVRIDPSAAHAIPAGFAAIAHVHRVMSFHEPTSDLARMRRARRDEVLELDPHTVNVLRIAHELHDASGGLFDVAIARHMIRARFLPRDGIAHLNRFLGDMSDLHIEDDTHVRMKRRVAVDLGGIAKGYAVDQAVAAMRSTGARYGIVRAGRDQRVFGDLEMTTTLRFGKGRSAKLGDVRDCAVAVSENARDRHTVDGIVRTPHIGRNGSSVLISDLLVVCADLGVIADAMTKVAMSDPALAGTLLKKWNGYVVNHDALRFDDDTTRATVSGSGGNRRPPA
jgi:FAD:protein FMN transferase